MSREIFYKIVDEIKNYNGVDVVVLYHGGEPFLNKDIFEMIAVFKAMQMSRIQTNTNGCVLKDDMLPKIIDSGLTRIEFSIDGLSPEENNQIRRGADYHKVSSIIKKLLLLKRKKGSLTPEVYIDNIQIPTEDDVTRGKKVSTPKYILDDFSDFKEEFKIRSYYMIKWPGFDYPNQYKLVEVTTSQHPQPLNFCDHIIELVTFRWNGDIVPCCYDITGEYIIGNIMENPLKELWNNKRYKALRKSIHLRNYIPLCAHCNEVQPPSFVVKKV